MRFNNIKKISILTVFKVSFIFLSLITAFICSQTTYLFGQETNSVNEHGNVESSNENDTKSQPNNLPANQENDTNSQPNNLSTNQENDTKSEPNNLSIEQDNKKTQKEILKFYLYFILALIGMLIIMLLAYYLHIINDLVLYDSYTDLTSCFFIVIIILAVISEKIDPKFEFNTKYVLLITLPFLIFSIKCSININDSVINIIQSVLFKIYIALLIAAFKVCLIPFADKSEQIKGFPGMSFRRREQGISFRQKTKDTDENMKFISDVVSSYFEDNFYKSISDSWSGR